MSTEKEKKDTSPVEDTAPVEESAAEESKETAPVEEEPKKEKKSKPKKEKDKESKKAPDLKEAAEKLVQLSLRPGGGGVVDLSHRGHLHLAYHMVGLDGRVYRIVP